ncbi:ATP-grasp domain-containing protein [Nocardia arthritidis]|uniref:ATP-grasp domain-containing protein n=1 Tax=Nocardia arthritidis TaxID=228602 RepID=A0A6G9YHP4_9NOCA|nr:hypothetical protein [Nocardia arthritidis]QIS12704.1 ATP-grasp domain-containing protein [Nocardia arthritidis]
MAKYPMLIVLGYRDDLDQALRRRGVDPYYIVNAPASPPNGRNSISVTDIEDVQELSRAVLAAGVDNADGVLTVHEFGVFGAAYLRQQLDLPGHRDPQKTLYFRDKYLQKNALPPEVRRARVRYVSAQTSYADIADELGDVFVIKPANGAGSLRTSIVHSPDEYAAAVEPLPTRSDVAIVAESHIDAPEIHIDGIWCGGALYWSSLARYNTSPLSAVQGRVIAVNILDERKHTELYRQARTLAEQVLGGLGAPDCVFHLEIFVEESGLTFGECAIRLPGGMTPRINELTFGVDLFDAEIDLALGMRPGPIPTTAPNLFHGYAFLRRRDDKNLTRQDFERRFILDEVEYSPETPPGPYGKVGHAIISDQDELKLQRRLEDIVRFNEAE